MDQEEWKKINNIVDAALKLEKDERLPFIKKECGGNTELLQQSKKLLQAIEESKSEKFLEETHSLVNQMANDVIEQKEQAQTSSLLGKTIDKYKITALIGHGGMGSVFKAKRADEAYDQQVALKVMRRGMDTPSNIARFKRERNILARLDHPNIARILDGGVTPDGLPYLVMEYVDGMPLLEYCNKNNLSTDERLTLFGSVGQAVRHAHQNAIIHRDLKPSNIFISDNGTVKVLDFGIAKLIESEPTDSDSFQTQTGSRILSFGYAAPEQVENNSITTATDTYTLGILLYELLMGSHPFDLADKDITTIEKIVRHTNPPNPSTKFQQLPASEKQTIADQRRTTPSSLSQTLQGDLDAIVCKALRKEPEARYNTVDQMLEDLNRYYQSRPLIAQSDTLRYQFGKFVKRNRRPLIAIILIIAAVIGFGSYHINQVTEERNIAERERQKAETVKNFLVDIFGSANPRSVNFEGKNITAQQLLVNGKNRIGEELKNQPDAHTEILLAIGDALKNIDAFEKAEEIYKEALAKSTETTKPVEYKLRTYVKLGWLITDWRSSQKIAQQHAENAQKLLKKIENPSPVLKASVFGLLGRVISVRRNHEKGIPYFEKADSIYVNAGLENSYDYIKMLTGYSRSLLYVFDFKKSVEMLQKSNKLYRQKYDNPTLTIAENYKFMAWSHRELGNFEESNNYFLKSIDLKRELIGGQTVQTAISMYHLARNYTLSGNFKRSEQLTKEVLNIYQENLEPGNQYILQAKTYLAIAKYNQNELAEAEKLLKNVIAKSNIQIYSAGVNSHLAMVYQRTGRFQEAISLLKESIKINATNLGPRSRGVAVDMLKLADTYRAMGDYEMAQKYFPQVKSIFKEEIPDNHYREAEFYFKYAKLKQETDNPREAQKYFNQAYNIYRDIFGEDSSRTNLVESHLDNLENKEVAG